MAKGGQAARQAVKLEFQLQRFMVNIKYFTRVAAEEMKRIVVAGASAYATSAQKHTPPSMGKTHIQDLFYEDGQLLTVSDREKTPGRRPIYDVVALARSEQAHDRGFWGGNARKGFLYAVKIFRGKKRTLKLCRTLEEARRYARMTYRGLLRAAWALNFAQIGNRGKLPPAFNHLLRMRPELTALSRMNSVTLDEQNIAVTLRNYAVPDNAGFVSSTKTNSSIAALRTMNDQMEKFFKKKYNL